MEKNYKADFPLLMEQDIAYLDSAATAQRPACVVEAVNRYYLKKNANPLRGFYDLAMEATDDYDEARLLVKKFIGAKKTSEIIFTRNTTESINLVAYSYAMQFLKPGDEILVTICEHHSNLLPWQMAAKATGAALKFLDCREDGSYREEDIEAAITPRTKLCAVQQVSNVLGTVTPLEKIIPRVHAAGGVVLVDGAQSAPHMAVDVRALDADFFAFSGHKLMAPMGIGVLYGKEELLKKMPPFLRGGEMIDSVTREGAVFAPLPQKFEAGTVSGGDAAGLAAAIRYINAIGFEEIEKREQALTRYAFKKMQAIPGVHIVGSQNPDDHHGILSFLLEDVHPHDISAILSADGVCIRAGHHCAQPLLTHLGISSCTRASLAFYNTEEDIDRLIESLSSVRRKMGYGA